MMKVIKVVKKNELVNLFDIGMLINIAFLNGVVDIENTDKEKLSSAIITKTNKLDPRLEIPIDGDSSNIWKHINNKNVKHDITFYQKHLDRVGYNKLNLNDIVITNFIGNVNISDAGYIDKIFHPTPMILSLIKDKQQNDSNYLNIHTANIWFINKIHEMDDILHVEIVFPARQPRMNHI